MCVSAPSRFKFSIPGSVEVVLAARSAVCAATNCAKKMTVRIANLRIIGLHFRWSRSCEGFFRTAPVVQKQESPGKPGLLDGIDKRKWHIPWMVTARGLSVLKRRNNGLHQQSGRLLAQKFQE